MLGHIFQRGKDARVKGKGEALHPYTHFRYIVRKWNSKELNVGVLEEKFELPEYPKVSPELYLGPWSCCLSKH